MSDDAHSCEIEISIDGLQGRVRLTRLDDADHWTFRFSPGSVATPR